MKLDLYNKDTWLKVLDDSFKSYLEDYKEENVYQFLSSYVFRYETYAEDMDRYMVGITMSVIKAVKEAKTFDYIKEEQGYIEYIVFVNMPFFANILNWGCSIRGAWFDVDSAQPFNVGSGLLEYDGKQMDFIVRHSDQLNAFIEALIEFYSLR